MDNAQPRAHCYDVTVFCLMSICDLIVAVTVAHSNVVFNVYLWDHLCDALKQNFH